jgi:hypothetical protein
MLDSERILGTILRSQYLYTHVKYERIIGEFFNKASRGALSTSETAR